MSSDPSNIIPETKDGDNLTVAVFRLPLKGWITVMKELFSWVEGHEECFIPHYTISNFETDSLTVSFRVLRHVHEERQVIATLTEFLKGYEYSVNPPEGSKFREFHNWIGKGENNPAWPKERCISLYKLSRFVIGFIKPEATRDDIIQWGHLFSNMTAISDFVRIVNNPETQAPEYLYYVDSSSAHALLLKGSEVSSSD